MTPLMLTLLLAANVEIKSAVARQLEAVSPRVRKQFPLGKLKYFVPLDYLDQKTLLGYSDNGAYTMNMDTARIDLRVGWPVEAKVFQVVLSPDKQTLFVGTTGVKEEQVVKDGKTSTIYHQLGGISAYAVESGKKLPLFEGREPTSVFEIAVSPDGRWLVWGERIKILDLTQPWLRTILFDLKSNEFLEIAKCDGSYSFSPDSKELFASFFERQLRSGELSSWSLPTREKTLVEIDMEVLFDATQVSADGKWTLCSRRKLKEPREPIEVELRRRDGSDIAWKTMLHSDDKAAYSMFDPKCRYLSVVNNELGCRFIDLQTLKEAGGFALPKEATIWYPHFSPDGRRFAVMTYDMTNQNARNADPTTAAKAVVWLADMSKPSTPERIVLPASRATQFVWTSDGKSIVVRGSDRMFVLDATPSN